MQFENLKALWFFISLPLLVVVFFLIDRKRKRILHHLVSVTQLSQKLPRYTQRGNMVQFLFFISALFLVGLALLKPYQGVETRQIAHHGLDVFFAVDLSSSMLAEDIKPNRLERAKFKMKDLLGFLGGARVGLIAFAGMSVPLVPLTEDQEVFHLFMNELSPDLLPVPGTDLTQALRVAVNSFSKLSQNHEKALILMTDGEDSVALDTTITETILKNNIKVFIIGMGTLEGAPIPLSDGGYKTDHKGNVVVSKLNEVALQELAVATGGTYVRTVGHDSDIKQILKSGLSLVLNGDKTSQTQKTFPHYRFQGILLLAFFLLVIETLSSNKKLKYFFYFLFLFSFGFTPSVLAKNPFVFESARRHFEKGQYQDALQQYLELQKNNPEDADVAYNLGNTYYRLGEYDRASEAFGKATQSKETELQKKSWYNKGDADYRNQKLEEALADYEQALKIDPQYEKAQKNYDFVKQILEQKKQQQQEQQQEQEQQKHEEPSQEKQNQSEQQQKQDQEKDQKNEKQSASNPAEEKQEQSEEKSGKEMYQWLEALEDDPGQALRFMIQKQAPGRVPQPERDW